MRLEMLFSAGGQNRLLPSLRQPLNLDDLIPGDGESADEWAGVWDGEWEVEIGFGKGRYLLERALAHPERRFLGFEVVSKYFRMLRRRARAHGVDNLLLVRGEALYALSAVLPKAFASILHIYFPDPWPKSRHQRRRLLDPKTLDLVLGVLRPGGELWFATDFIDYGERVVEILRAHPGLDVEIQPGPWPDGARTNYEAKYMQEGRPILRLRARSSTTADPAQLHPEGKIGVLSAVTNRRPPPPA